MRLRPDRRRVLLSSSTAAAAAAPAWLDPRVAPPRRIRRFIRIGVLLTVIAVRPRWRPLLAGVALTVIGALVPQVSVLFIPGMLAFWRALMIPGDADIDLKHRAQLKRELAAYSTPAQRAELMAALTRYPDRIADDMREILAIRQ